MSAINDVKNKIKAKLDTLVPTYLKGVTLTDIKKDPLDMEIQSYPHAFIMPPAIQTVDWEDNRSVIRDLVFTIMVLQKQDNITTTSEIEDLMQAMLDVIDNSISFDGVAIGGVFPTSSFPEPFVHGGRSLVVFDIIIKARVLQTLTYS